MDGSIATVHGPSGRAVVRHSGGMYIDSRRSFSSLAIRRPVEPQERVEIVEQEGTERTEDRPPSAMPDMESEEIG